MYLQTFYIMLMLGSIKLISSQFIYLNTGVFKFIAGIGLPIDVEMSGGSISWFANTQVFYKLPDNITYFEPYKLIQKRSVKNTFNRTTFYQLLMTYLERLGFSGDECIHRVICEVASRRINQRKNGLLGDIIRILFSPRSDSQGCLEEHKAAEWQGLFNTSECGVIYKDCHMKENSIFLL